MRQAKILHLFFFTLHFFLILTFFLQPCVVSASTDPLNLYATSAALIDASSGRLLYGKDPYNELPMASTTKIMTCILALECGDPDEIVTVSSYAASMPDVQLNILEGEQYYLGDLLYAMMLESYNDVAVAIAEHIGGSVEGFAGLMNEKAEQLGLSHTHFVTPNGLDADGHYTTAYDLAILGAYAIANEDFLAVTNTSAWSFSTVDGARSFTASNKDAFLTQMDGAIGIKTGYTSQAGYCFVGALQDGSRTFVSVVLASGWPPNKAYKWSDTRKLMEYGLANYTYRCIFTPIDHFATLTVTDGLSDTVDTWIDGSLNLLMREDETVNVIYDYEDTLAAPVAAGEIVGYAYITLDNSLVEAYPIRAAESVKRKDYLYYLNRVMKSLTASFF